MIQTSIIVGHDEGMPIWHKSAGFAKTLTIAKWLFEYCGWKQESSLQSPELCYLDSEEEWVDGDKYFPCDQRELFILENRLLMN